MSKKHETDDWSEMTYDESTGCYHNTPPYKEKPRKSVEWLLNFEWSFDMKEVEPLGIHDMSIEELVKSLYPDWNEKFFNMEMLKDFKGVTKIRSGKTILTFERKTTEKIQNE